MINQLYFFLLSILIHTSSVVCMESYQDIQLTFDNLTDSKMYKKWIQPSPNSNNSNGILYVNVSIDMYNYATVDEITSEYTFHVFIDLEWFDLRLKYNIFSKDGFYLNEPVIEGGQYHIHRIWYPSVFIPNNQDPGSFDYDNQSANLVKIKHDGHVWLRKRKMLRVYCDMDFHYYPFDEQKCFLHLESSISTVNILRLQWNPNVSFCRADSFRTIGFNLKDHETIIGEKSYSKNNSFSRVSLKFTLVREWAHQMFLFYLPTAIIVIASWASFWLEITSPPARVSIGVTTMLALVTTFKNTKSQLPSVSYWNALDIWNMVCIVFIFSSLMEFALVNYIFNTEKRRKKNKKLKRVRQKSVLKANQSLSRRSSALITSDAYMSTISAFNDLNSKLSNFGLKRKPSNANESDLLTTARKAFDGKNSTFDISKSRRASLGIDVTKQMPDIREEQIERRQRLASVRSRAQSISQQQVSTEMCLKLTPQELANSIDQKCRRIFPLSFLIFNLMYWTILLHRI